MATRYVIKSKPVTPSATSRPESPALAYYSPSRNPLGHDLTLLLRRLKYITGLPSREIARQLDLNPRTVTRALDPTAKREDFPVIASDDLTRRALVMLYRFRELRFEPGQKADFRDAGPRPTRRDGKPIYCDPRAREDACRQ
jgi:hypothetical protein